MNEARILHMQERIARYYQRKLRSGPTVSKAEDVAGWATAKFGSSRIEHLWALALDGRNRVYAWQQLAQGTLDRAAFYPRELARWALLRDAAGVILIHNHPSGSTRPSDADLCTNRKAKDALALFDIRLLDSLIVTPEGQFFSAQQSGLI